MADSETLAQLRNKEHDIVIRSLDDGDRMLFKGCEFVRTAVICEGVTALPDGLFAWCRRLKSVSLPESLTHIGSRAFEMCTSLKNVTLPSGLREMGEFTFHESGIERIQLPESITDLPDSAFRNCHRLFDVMLPQSLERIGHQAFKCCFALKSISLPDGITYIGTGAFYRTGLESIVLPPKLTEISEGAFCHCYALARVSIPAGLTRIGRGSFYCCRFRSIRLPKGLIKIESCAFSHCHKLKRLTVPNSVEKIGSWAFGSCGSLENLRLPKNLKGVKSLLFLNDKIKEIELPANAVIEDTVIIHLCSNLEKITLSFRTLSGITDYSFDDLPALRTVVVDGLEHNVKGKLDTDDLYKIAVSCAEKGNTDAKEYIKVHYDEMVSAFNEKRRTAFIRRLNTIMQ